MYIEQQDADRRCKLSRDERESVRPEECKSPQLCFQPPLLPIVRTFDNHFVRIRVHVVDLMPSRPAVPAYGIHIREGFAARRAPECIGMLRALVGLEAAVRMSHPSAKRTVQLMHRALEATGTTNGIAPAPEWNNAEHARTLVPENYKYRCLRC